MLSKTLILTTKAIKAEQEITGLSVQKTPEIMGEFNKQNSFSDMLVL